MAEQARTACSRISRSIRDFYEFWSVLEQHHVTFVSATESFDTSTAAGSLMVNLLLSFGAWEVAVVSERTSMKMLARARKGLWNGGHVPLGYGYSKDEQLLIPDPDESQIVVSVFEALVREGSIAGVRQFANERGYRSKVRSVTDRAGQVREVGGKPFSYDLIRQIVTNPLYKGCVRYGDELFTGNQQPLVSTELWDQANEVLRRRVRGNPSPARTPDSHIHLFKGLLRCGECGASMTPYPSGKRRPDGSAYLYYTCLNAIKHRQHCTCQVRSVPARAFEDAVLEAWERLGSDPSLVERCLVEGSESERQDMARLHRRLEGLRSELRDVDERMRRLLGVFEESESVPEGMKVRLCELDEQQAGLRLEIAQIQHELDDLGGEAPTPQEIADFLRAFTEGIRGLPMAEKKARIRSVIGRLTHNHLPPSEGPESALASCTEGRFRTSRILVMTRINSKPPESADSGGLSAESHNQMASGSGREVVGSAGRIRTCDLKVMSLASYRTAPPRVHLQWTISIAMPNTRVKPFRMPKRILTPLPKAPCGTRSRQLSTSEWGYPPGYPQLSTAGGPRNPRWKRSTCNPRARPTAVLHPSALDNPGRLSTATGCASDAEKTLCRPY